MNQSDTNQISHRRNRVTMTPLMWGLLIAFLVAALITAYLTFAVVREYFTFTDERPAPQNLFSPQEGQESSQNAPLPAYDTNQPMQNVAGPTSQPWDGANRVTLLLLGLDYRDWEEGQGAARTDTMILLTVDPVSRTAGILSIPRDLWVNIPSYEYGKINTAYYLGEVYNLEGGGPGLAIKTVEEMLGITINYYAQVDFFAFERFIDIIGGIVVDVPEEMSVDPIGPGNTVTLPAGQQRLNGATSLAYARNRDTLGGDFDRAQRQQQVIMAVRNQVMDLEMLNVLIQKSPLLYNELSKGIHSNLTLDEMIRLAWLAQQISPENIHRGAIGIDQVTITVSPDGLDILQPDMDAVRLLRDEVFTTNTAISPMATAGSLEELVQSENATISILNATYTPGLASETMQFLQSKGLNVTNTGNAEEALAETTIIDYSGKPYTYQYLIDLLQIQPTATYNSFDPNSTVDIVILLGNDWVQNNPMP